MVFIVFERFIMENLKKYIKRQINIIQNQANEKCFELMKNEEKLKKIQKERKLYEETFSDWKIFNDVEIEMDFKKEYKTAKSFDFIEKIIKEEKLLLKEIEIQRMEVELEIKKIVDLRVNLNYIKEDEDED